MLRNLLGKIIGDPNEKELERIRPFVEQINALEPTYLWMTNEELRAQTNRLRARLQHGETLDDILPDAFALVREAAKRSVGMRHFDVQLIGGIVLHQGKVAEMKTGEGKTLVATLPVYLNALTGKGVHLITVNDYLARRDAVWMGPVYALLGLSIGLLQQSNKSYRYEPGHTRSEFRDLQQIPRGEAYAADITYGTNHEFGFDYLRDNLAYATAYQVQRPLAYAIVDEVDNVFIDEARTPLIISGASEESDEEYRRFATVARKLDDSVDFEVDEKARNVFLTEAGLAKVEELANIDNIYDPVNQRYIHYMEQAVKAQVIFQEGVDYIRQRDRIVLVDEFTGRLMPDRRLSDGLHQAIEAKHGVKIRPRMITQATITIQNYFRMYPKLAGMTGTALSESEEFDKIYSLDVVVIPTNKPVARDDASDVVFRTTSAKMNAIVEEIQLAHDRGQPVLVGTTSIERSEDLSRALRDGHIEHHVLNAKEHEREGQIIARAGEPGKVTVATNMAGRGVDIKLGGELPDETIDQAQRVLRQRGMDPFEVTPEQFDSAVAEVDPDYALKRERVLEAGGLYVLGTERHDARRIDNQLRGRSGRQGEPGLSRFFLSLEDDLMRRFGGTSVSNLMARLGVEDDMPIEHGLVSRSIESAQTRVEGHNFDIRKHLLEYDDVLNQQRELIYGQRQRILTKDDLWPDLWNMIDAEIESRRGDLSQQAGRAWELVNFYDTLMPLSYAPVQVQKGSKGKRGKTPGTALAYESMRYPYTLSSVRSIFLPFSISFLAAELSDLPAGERQESLLSTARSGIQMYRDYVMEQAIGESFARAETQYDQGWEQQKELLEQRIMTYLDMIEERGRTFDPRDMIDQVQRGLPVKLSLSSQEMADMDVDDIRTVFQDAMVQAYHISTCDQLVRRAAGQLPASLGLATAQIDLIDPEDRRRILDRASLRAYSDDARRRLEQMAGQQTGNARKEDRSLFGWLSRVLTLARLDLVELERVLRDVTADRYDAWAAQTLEEIDKRASNKAADEGWQAVGQWLLDSLAIVDAQSFKIAWRIPPAFLVMARCGDILDDRQSEVFRDHLQDCITERQAVWGEAEFTRYNQMNVSELGHDYLDGLTRFWGRRIVGGSEKPVEALPAEHLSILERAAAVSDLHELKIGAWPMFDAIAGDLGASVESRLLPQRGIHDQPLLSTVESALQQEGVFDDASAEAQFSSGTLSELNRAERDALATHLGENTLNPLRTEKTSALEPALQERIIDILTSRGRFTDEKRVQEFLIRQRLNDVGAERAEQACRWLTGEQLRQYAGRTIAELDPAIHDWVMQALRDAGYLWDEPARERALTQPISNLADSERDALAIALGSQVWSRGTRAGELDDSERQTVRQALDDAGLFLLRERFNAFGLADLHTLPSHLAEDLRVHLEVNTAAMLNERAVEQLPPILRGHVREELETSGFFIDHDKMSQLEQQTLASLDGDVLLAIELSVGLGILAEVDQRKFINLDKDLRDSVLAYLDSENIYRKSSKRRAFMQRPLAELDKAIYDGIAQNLGRQRLSNLRSQSIATLPADVRDLAKTELQTAGELLDAGRIEAFEQSSVSTLPTEQYQRLLAHLKQILAGLFAGDSSAELYDGMLLDARQFLSKAGYFTREGADEEFVALTPEVLDVDLRDAAYHTLGGKLLDPIREQAPNALPADVGTRVQRAIDLTDVFIEPNKERSLRSTRLSDLSPAHREAIVTLRARNLLQAIGNRPVSSLKEETRQALRTYLDDAGYFANQDAVQQLAEQQLATLRRADWQALALTVGSDQLKTVEHRPLAEIEPALREAILTHFRSRGQFLDEERRADFRRRGLAALSDEERQSALAHARDIDRQRIEDARLADLPKPVQWEIEHLAIDAAEPVDYRRSSQMEAGALAQLPPAILDPFMRYLGYPHTSELLGYRLADLQGDAREVMRDFLGDRVALELQKRVMLTFVSRLWIDYLTDMENMRQGIGLEAFGQRDPLVEYKRRAYQMFQQLMEEIRQGIVSRVFALEPAPLPMQAGN